MTDDDSELFLRPLPVVAPAPRASKSTRTRKPLRTLRPGDPACWAWQPFNFGRRLTPEKSLRALYAWHKGCCGICGEVPRLLVVDHDHQTSLARGLLCDDCNKAEGTARDKDDVFARWRAVPATAILGLVFVYVSTHKGVADPMPFKVTGPVYLPEWAPDHMPWPPDEALTVTPKPTLGGRPRRPPEKPAQDIELATALLARLGQQQSRSAAADAVLAALHSWLPELYA